LKKGFSLIEVAIGLVIFGIILSIGVGTMKWAIKNYHFNQNREKVSSDIAAIKAYISSHKGRSPSDCISVLPHKKDEWGKDVVCVIDKDVQSHNICALSQTSTEIEDEEGNKISNIAVVVISGSENMNIQTSNGTHIKIYPPGYPNVDDYPYDFTRKEPYDDVVKYATLEELKQETGCTYSEETLHIITLSLPSAIAGESYEAKIYATGGVPDNKEYFWCYEAEPSFSSSGLNVKCGSKQAKTCNDTSKCEYLEISGIPTKAPATYRISVTVRDSQSNNDTRSYVITVNPSSGTASGNSTCKSYTLNIKIDTPPYECYLNSKKKCSSGIYSNLKASDSLQVWRKTLIKKDLCIEGTLASLDSNNDCTVRVNCQKQLLSCDCSVQ